MRHMSHFHDTNRVMSFVTKGNNPTGNISVIQSAVRGDAVYLKKMLVERCVYMVTSNAYLFLVYGITWQSS